MKSLKTLFILALVAGGFAAVQKSEAAGQKYYVALTTVPTNGTAGEFAANYPNISTTTAANLYIRKIIIANSTATTTQTISVFDTCTSTTAASLKLRIYTGAASQVQPDLRVFDFLPQSFKLSGACFNKSSTLSTVDMTVFYE